ncbi:MAG: cysteine-rich KTR domain-containing protein [Defluviitaleaceae bacterium]|nr:cysteine-rich KTR domain-containing protein [Defluviitaleaceae bacterium]
MGKQNYIHCPLCSRKTKVRYTAKTALANYPLWCSYCRETIIVTFADNEIKHWQAITKLQPPKIYISQPTEGKTTEEIKQQRNQAETHLKDLYENPIFITSVRAFGFTEQVGKKAEVLYTAKSIEQLSQADTAVFIEDWRNDRICLVEYHVAREFHIPLLFSDDFALPWTT